MLDMLVTKCSRAASIASPDDRAARSLKRYEMSPQNESGPADRDDMGSSATSQPPGAGTCVFRALAKSVNAVASWSLDAIIAYLRPWVIERSGRSAPRE